MSDFMELGDSGLVPQEDGWYLDTHTGNRIAPNGCVFDSEGEIVFDPEEEYGRE